MCAAPAAPAAARTEHTAAALHLELHLHSPAQNQYHAYGTAGGEKTFVGQREEWLDEIFHQH